MKALIIEDESAAAQNLRSILRTIEQPSIEVIAHLESVVDSVEYLRHNASQVELIFMDIHLADGSAFNIFDRIEITCPIIFTTAYDQYALQAFKVSSVDYLLKPMGSDEVRRALEKLQNLTSAEVVQYSERVRQAAGLTAEYMRSLLIHQGDKIIPLSLADVAFIYSSADRVVAYTFGGDTLPVDRSLESLISQLDPVEFYRANRQFIVARSSIHDVSVWFGSRLSLNLTVEIPEKIIIPKARTAEFKEWLTAAK